MSFRFFIDMQRWAVFFGAAALGFAAQAESDADRESTKIAVGLHRVEAPTARRLTPAELAELREQVRQQWTPRQQVVQSGDASRDERLAAPPADGVIMLPRSRAQ